MRVALLAAAALIGFSANSLLTRAALGSGRLDPATFMIVRVATGALTLSLIAAVRASSAASLTRSGSWRSGLWLAGYAICFTVAYGHIGAAVGALLLFGSVQITMIGTGLVRGERPSRVDWAGVWLAVSGLLVFTVPGATAPDPMGAMLMVAAGACWGAYSLAGRGSRSPLATTAANFARALVPVVIVGAALIVRDGAVISTRGIWLATASGTLASGLGYTLWYAALPSLSAWRAGVMQLTVPVVTALAAAVLLGESLSTRLAIATGLVMVGVWIASRPSIDNRGR